MVDQREKQNFIVTTTDLGVIASGAEGHVNLESIKTEFGHNFNTLNIKNNADEEISITLDGRKIIFIASGDGFSIDHEDKILYDHIIITNEHGSTSTSANEIRISVGRTGQNGL